MSEFVGVKEKEWASVLLILAFTITFGVLMMGQMDAGDAEREEVTELKSDMLSLNRTISTMGDRQAIVSVNHIQERLEDAERNIGHKHDLKVQRVLGESTFILLELHRNLKDRRVKKDLYPSSGIFY